MNVLPSRFVCVDTEFLRETTYWPKLCLVQLGFDDGRVEVLDPIAGDNLDDLKALLADETITKVFHAGRQDIEIFVELFGFVPRPLFDTQVAAQGMGYADQVAYAVLVRDILGITIDKAQQFTDWSRRPLKPEQISYAKDDVIHLCSIYRHMQEKLGERLHWLAEDMAALSDTRLYKSDPSRIWERVKIKSDKPPILAVLRALAAWRETEAMRLNQPRGRILKDDTLAELALTQPKTLETLGHVRLFPKSWLDKKQGQHILDLIQAALNEPRETMPKREHGPHFPLEAQSRLEMLKLLLKLKANAHNVAAKLIAGGGDLDLLALGKDSPVLTGWRAELFGNDAKRLLAGELFMGLSAKGEIVLK